MADVYIYVKWNGDWMCLCKHQPAHDSKIHSKVKIPFCFTCKASCREAD